MRPAPYSQLRAGANGANFGCHEYLIGGQWRQLDLADGGPKRFDDNGLTSLHGALGSLGFTIARG
jgi:hypothetical protein